MDQELDDMIRLNLLEYLAGEGYRIDEHKSDEKKGTYKMWGPNGDILWVTRRDDGGWVYWNPLDESDKGTIVQYLQQRRGGKAAFTIGHVKKHLRGKVGGFLRGAAIPKGPRPIAVRAPKDLSQIPEKWNQARAVWGLPHYLESRGLTAETVTAYASALHMDKKANRRL
ncbi:MAG: hypothetical protein HQL37_14820 [Alphaproteobacteria bacterium]|nr:hypothetical protein [Alphaproteobacteria bacterium]